MTQSGGGAGGNLSINGEQPAQQPAAVPPAASPLDRFQAVVNCHGCNLQQIEVAIQANSHAVDPHPGPKGSYVMRHPIILTAFDPSNLDDQGRPAEGQPAELNMTAIRQVFSSRYPHVSPNPPPEDGSHIKVEGMHFVAEKDHLGQATGRVKLGNPGD